MMRACAISVAFLTFLGTAPVLAQSIEDFELNTARDLVDVCDATGDDTALAYCYGYIVGGADLYARLVEARAIENWICAEPTPSLNEIRVAYLDWAQAHAAALGGHPADAFWEAMSVAYPCD